MNKKMYYTAAEVAELLGISKGKAYQIIREMNEELKKLGYLVIKGKVPVEYFNEKWYGATKEVVAWA
ncbi:MAG: helix-turn-helix domain-containing protein [Eubacteriales bacterium]|nr:helix-turn-helix domain-containing protein [Eubacteriales bacterium]